MLMPAGTFYVFPDVSAICRRLGITSHGLAMYLLEGADDQLGVACLGGECFGAGGPGLPALQLRRAGRAAASRRCAFLADAVTRTERVAALPGGESSVSSSLVSGGWWVVGGGWWMGMVGGEAVLHHPPSTIHHPPLRLGFFLPRGYRVRHPRPAPSFQGAGSRLRRNEGGVMVRTTPIVPALLVGLALVWRRAGAGGRDRGAAVQRQRGRQAVRTVHHDDRQGRRRRRQRHLRRPRQGQGPRHYGLSLRLHRRRGVEGRPGAESAAAAATTTARSSRSPPPPARRG